MAGSLRRRSIRRVLRTGCVPAAQDTRGGLPKPAGLMAGDTGPQARVAPIVARPSAPNPAPALNQYRWCSGRRAIAPGSRRCRIRERTGTRPGRLTHGGPGRGGRRSGPRARNNVSLKRASGYPAISPTCGAAGPCTVSPRAHRGQAGARTPAKASRPCPPPCRRTPARIAASPDRPAAPATAPSPRPVTRQNSRPEKIMN